MYWAFRNWLCVEAARFGYRVTLVDTSDLAAVRAAVAAGTALVYVETPGNPLWAISDIAAIAQIAHARGALLAIDSTVATPIFTRPLALGADIVMHSASKYLNGHSDVIAGALARATRLSLWERVLDDARAAWRDPGTFRGLAAPARTAHPRRAAALSVTQRRADRRPTGWHIRGRAACSIQVCRAIPATPSRPAR